jgi:hypothetical protein
VTTDLDLSWPGDLLTPELTQAARWAMANVTFFTFSAAQCAKEVTSQCPLPHSDLLIPGYQELNKTAGPITVMCAIYPCTRKTVPSITSNKLSELPLDTSMIWPVRQVQDLDSDESDFTDLDARSNFHNHYAGIQSPCRVNQKVYKAQNMSSAPNPTKL